MMFFIARLSVAFLSIRLATSTSFYPLKIGQGFQAAYSDNDIFRGFKLNGDDVSPLKAKVFNGNVNIIPFASTYDRATFIKDYNDVEESMNIYGSLSVTYKMMIKGEATANYFQKTASTKNSQTIKYQLRRVAYAKKVDTSSLTPNDEVNAFANTGNLDELADKYGTKFVDQMLYGAQLDLDFTFSSNDEKDIQEISAELEGEINLKAIQIAFEAQFALNSTVANRNFRVDITASTSGLADFSIPANPNFEQVIDAIDIFQKDYSELVQEAEKLEQADEMENVLTKFSPVGFGVSSIADYLPKLNKMEAAALENKMEDVADVFFSTLFLKDQLKSTRDGQGEIYTDSRDKSLWFNPYADEVDRVIELLDEKLDECLDFQRLPMEVIIGRTKVDVDGKNVTAMVPEPNAIGRDIKDGLLGKTFLPSDVTILNTEFKNKHYVGFGLKVNNEKKHCESCPMKPWLSGSLREINSDGSYRAIATEDTPGKLVKSAKEKIELDESEVRIDVKVNNNEKQFLLNEWTETTGNYNWESFKMIDSGLRSLPFEYKAYVEDLGLQDWKSSGFVGNPSNVTKFMEAFAIRIIGKTQHSVSYAAKIEHPNDGIVTTRKFRDGEVCCIRHGGKCLKAPIKAFFVSIETKKQYATCKGSSPCLCEDSICHDATETTSHAPSAVPSLYPTMSPSTMVPSINPTSSPMRQTEGLIAVGTDNNLYTRASLRSNWGLVPNSCCVSGVTVMNDGTIVGIGLDKNLYTRTTLNSGWKIVPGSCCLIGVTIMNDGTILGIGTDNNLYTRTTLNSRWELVPNSGLVNRVTVMNDGTIVGIGLDKNLYTRTTLTSGWKIVPGSCCLIGVTTMDDGAIVGVGTNNNLYTRATLNSGWIHVRASGDVTAVSTIQRGLVVDHLIEGAPIRCHGIPHAVYRYTFGERRWYPSPAIAESWDPNWSKFTDVNCIGIPEGPQMPLYS